MDYKIKNQREIYYKAYDERYAQVYEKNMMWSSSKHTPDVVEFLKAHNVTTNSKILDLGCGEGRDAIHLLKQGYDVLALDYSKKVINMCNKITDNRYQNKFNNLI